MIFEEHKSLKNLNTFGFEQFAQYYCEPSSVDEMLEALAFARDQKIGIFVLGAGSNIILSQDIAGLTIRQRSGHISFKQGSTHTNIVCDAGINWHQLVLSTLENNLYGLENLSLIPGDVGAAPIQNIGAYGVEIGDVLTRLTAMDLESGDITDFSRTECNFGYRDSIFKRSLHGRFAILNIELRLHHQPQVNTEYRALSDELKSQGLENPTPIEISQVVCQIRKAKLPDPEVIGNAGSFFKNPVVSASQCEQLRTDWPTIPGFRQPDGSCKVPAAWLIETAGWKGKRIGNVGVHSEQALVLVHYGGSSGSELLSLAKTVKDDVQQKFDVSLEQEPSII